MITVEEAFNELPKKIQKLVTKAFKYGDSGYMFIAPEGDDDASDPFYLVTGPKHIYELNPFDDLDGFEAALNNPVNL